MPWTTPPSPAWPPARARPGAATTPDAKTWLYRYGWNRPADPPPYLADAKTTIRKVEFTDQYDLKERMSLGSDGIAETTWPGVYNRSKLPGRHDYFELPDWNVYVEGGKAITFTLPDEPYNRLEFQGAAYGALTTDRRGRQGDPAGQAAQGRTAHLQPVRDPEGRQAAVRQRGAGNPDPGAGGLQRHRRRRAGRVHAGYVVRPGADPAPIRRWTSFRPS
jgi:hypothetical protein